MTTGALSIRIRGVVQGVGFRPFVYRLAIAHGIAGWVLNGDEGVLVRAEGPERALASFLAALREEAPPAAQIAELTSEAAAFEGHAGFAIRTSAREGRPTVRIAPDLPLCAACRAELFDPADRRHGYPYINCTDCGPRYSIVRGLPYDRPLTTMAAWPLCEHCAREYDDPGDRRFHAQPVACPACGPHVRLHPADGSPDVLGDGAAIAEAARRLAGGEILAVKGIGGYHLACDARNAASVAALRLRKFRKERPFALMAKDLATARELVALDEAGVRLVTGTARPIVLAPARVVLPGVAPDTAELGVMLPYAPLHELLFAAGAPAVMVMTSANRSSEPIAYRDEDALRDLAGLADAWLVGERPIARRVDDSIARVTAFGPVVLRHARGYSPRAVGTGWPAGPPVLAVGGDLKNAVTLVVDGQAFVAQHVGDLEQQPARDAFEETCDDLCRMYDVDRNALVVAHDLHPDYVSSRFARQLGARRVAVQHHRAHVASVLAEHGCWDERVLGVAWDGTGYGDDGSIWGGEFFAGSVRSGFERVAHLRPAMLPGGDAAARHPVQSAAGFLAQVDAEADGAALGFPPRFALAREMVRAGTGCHATTSVGRLFDAVAALCGFTRGITYEGQAAIWLEQLARGGRPGIACACPWDGEMLDWRPALGDLVRHRGAGRDPADLALAFHAAAADALAVGAERLARRHGATAVVLSGGVFQNALLLELVAGRLAGPHVPRVLVHHDVPPNDGGLAPGQAALAACAAAGGD